MPSPSPTYSQPKIRQIVLEAIFRRKRLFWWTVGIVVGLVAVVTFAMPKKYQAEAKLMVQNVRTSSPLTTTPSDRMVTSGTVPAEQIATQVELLQSSGVARRAVGGDPAGTESAGADRAAEKLQKALKVEAVHQTNLIDLKLLGNSAEQATGQLQRIIDAYFNERAGSGLASGAVSFFEDQLKFKQRQLEEDQKLLTDFQVEHGIADLDEEKKIQTERVASLTNEYMSAEAQLAAMRSKAKTDSWQLSITPARTHTTERSITNQYSQEKLSTELVDLQNRLTELLKRYPPTDRQVVETREKMETVRRAESMARNNPASEQASDVNPVFTQLSAAVATSAGEASARAAQAAKISEQLKEAQLRLDDLNQATARYDELKRNLAEAQRDYSVYAQKRDEARVSEELDKARLFDVSLVQPPIALSKPVRPRPKLYMAAGLVFGFMLATLLALYADISSDTVYLPSQLDALTGVRTLATIAEENEEDAVASNRLAYRKILLTIRNALQMQESARKRKQDEFRRENGYDGFDERESREFEGWCVAFLSPLRNEGVSYVVRNLATEAALHAAFRVVVIDAALLLRQFTEKGDAGFSLKRDEQGGFWELDSDGSVGNGTSRVSRGASLHKEFSWRLRPLMVQLREDFDYVFVDCPSLAASALSGELDRVVDAFVGVVGAGYARKQNIDGMAAMFEDASAPVLGYVLTRREYPVPHWLHRLI